MNLKELFLNRKNELLNACESGVRWAKESRKQVMEGSALTPEFAAECIRLIQDQVKVAHSLMVHFRDSYQEGFLILEEKDIWMLSSLTKLPSTKVREILVSFGAFGLNYSIECEENCF